MTSKLKCPFCGVELQKTYEPEEYWCSNYSCGKPHPFNLQGTKELWQALIQAKQDLETTTNASEEIAKEHTGTDGKLYACSLTAQQALEIIGNIHEQKETK